MAYKGSLERSGILVKIHMPTLFLAIWVISGNDRSPWYLCSLLIFSSGEYLLPRAAVRRDGGCGKGRSWPTAPPSARHPLIYGHAPAADHSCEKPGRIPGVLITWVSFDYQYTEIAVSVKRHLDQKYSLDNLKSFRKRFITGSSPIAADAFHRMKPRYHRIIHQLLRETTLSG